MSQKLILTWCKTKNCIYNENDKCTQIGIYIDKGRCGSHRDKKYYYPNGEPKPSNPNPHSKYII